MSIEVRNVNRNFGSFAALKDVSLQINDGELTALLGPSGSGKTTLLRMIAGLDLPDSGSILFHGRDACDQSVRDRGVGFVFQHYALFKHMSVFENVAFGLRVRPRRTRPSNAQIRERVHNLLKLVQLDWLGDRYPAQLSGGQRQRVALARALAVEPKVLLLDEPFGALDAKVRQELRQWLRRLHDEIHVTSVFVTHDQEEALELADRVVVMNHGQIEQVGTPEEVFHNPTSEFVIHFLGQVNVFHARVENGKACVGGMQLEYPQATQSSADAKVFVRPHDLDVAFEPGGNGHLRATVRHINAAGPHVKVEMQTDNGEQVLAELTHERYRVLELCTGATVFVLPRQVRVFAEDYSI